MLNKCGIFSLTAILTTTLLFTSSSFAAPSVSDPAVVKVETTTAHYQQIPASALALGTLMAVQSTGLSFRTNGHLEQKLFKDGAIVKKGDVIAKLDDSTIASQLASAKANLDEAQSKYNRYDLLKGSGVFSKQDYIAVSTALKVAKAQYASVLEQEQQLSLIAPFAGTLGKYNFSIGSQVSVGTVIVNLVQLDPLKVNYSLGQADKGKVKIGQEVLVFSDAWAGKTFYARVSYISPTVNSNTGRFDVEALLPNPENKLSPGSLVRVEHILGKGKQALVVPQTAVSVDEDRSYVYVVKNGKAQQQTVVVGKPTNNGNIIIQSGLLHGQQIVANGVQKLSQNMPVQVEKRIITPSESNHSESKNNASASNQESKTEKSSVGSSDRSMNKALPKKDTESTKDTSLINILNPRAPEPPLNNKANQREEKANPTKEKDATKASNQAKNEPLS